MRRPAPITDPSPAPASVDASSSVDVCAQQLLAGKRLVVTDRYSTGVHILGALDHAHPVPHPDAPFVDRDAHRRQHRDAARNLLARVEHHNVELAGAESSGFLVELYPDLVSFLLPLVDLQELRGAWQVYTEGVHVPVLGHKLHPFFGTYVPSRMVHLELFATWWSQFHGLKDRAVDIGTGCGVLALQLCRAGCGAVVATDANPNAVESVRRELVRLEPTPPIELREGDLFAGAEGAFDLVVMNPPWLPGTPRSSLDEALLSDGDVLPRLFDAALEHLAPQGRLVLLYSNIQTLVRPDLPHPIQAELEKGRYRQVNLMRRRVKPPPGQARTRERVEVWELEKV